jgi:hypothetical protein
MASPTETLPKRACFIFFPNGVSLPPADHPAHQDWHWFPFGEGRDYRFTRSLAPLEPHRQEISILQGLSHPLGRTIVGHTTADTFLTGGDVSSVYNNTISIDQVIARETARHTRYPSLVLSSDGGIGFTARTGTLSFNKSGQPIPAESDPRRIFHQLFGTVKGQTDAQQRASLRNTSSMLDFLLEDSRRLQLQLGRGDSAKLDEYLTSVREVEQQVVRTDAWLDVAKPEVGEDVVNLEAVQADPAEYIKTIYDLLFLAFRTDSTRVATYQISREDGQGIGDKFPSVLGFKGSHHGLSHSTATEDGYENWGRYDEFLSAQFAQFVQRLKSTAEGDGTLLDRTMLLYGCSTSTTHNARNYPIVLAGGRTCGLQHGQLHRYSEETPFSNVLLTMAHAMDIPQEQFADSTGILSEI